MILALAILSQYTHIADRPTDELYVCLNVQILSDKNFAENFTEGYCQS